MSDEGKAAEGLLDELGKEMFETTGGDRWKSGQPLAGSPEADAAKDVPAKEPEKAESTSAEKKLIAGKFETVEAAEKGIHEMGQLISQKTASEEALTRKAEALEAALRAVVGVKPAAEPAPEAVDPLESLEKEWGLPKAPIEKALEQKVEQKLQAMFKPIVDRQKADAEIVKQFPEYEKSFDGLLEFLEKNPKVKEQVEYAERQGQYLMAREYAWLQFERTVRNEQKVSTNGVAKVQAEKRAEALQDAGVTAATRSDGRKPPGEAVRETGGDWPDAKRMEYLQGLAQRGHQDVLWRETIGKILDKQGFSTT